MQGVEERQVEIDMAANAGEAAARVTRPVPQDGAANRVGDARLQPLEGRVLAAEPLPVNEPAPSPASAMRARKAGMNAGLFCPSPSSVTISGARDTDTALLTAADLPHRGLVPEVPQPGPRRGQGRRLVAGTVIRSVVDHHDLERYRRP